MYVFDFLKRLLRKSNFPIVIYLVLNVLLIAGVIYGLVVWIGDAVAFPFWKAAIFGVVLYTISLFIALSPIGEWILRVQTRCGKIKRIDQLNYLEPLFTEVYGKAKRLDKSISNDVRLFISDDDAPNAFATGRKTVCVTSGMLKAPPNQLKAVLAHEFGHLAHKDTDMILVISVGNLLVTGLILYIRLLLAVMLIFLFVLATVFDIMANVVFHNRGSSLAKLLMSLVRKLILGIVSGLTKLWTWIGTMLVMKSSRANEYEADEFAYNLGYGNELCRFLDGIKGAASEATGLFAALASSHPKTDDRIAKLQALGASYRH